MRGNRNLYVGLCFGIILAVCGCQQVPDDVKEKSRNYQRAENVEETDIKYVSVDHILDGQEEILANTYQNLEFQDTVNLEQPDSVSVLSLTVAKSFGSGDKLGDICCAFFGTDKYRDKIERIEDTRIYLDQGAFAFNFNAEDADSADIWDNGFAGLAKKNAKLNALNDNGYHPVVCHADRNENMDAAYEIGGERVSVREAVDFVNDWCDKNWAVLEPEYTYQVKNVYVCPAEDKGYYYYFEVCKFYKGMPFDDISFHGDENHDYYIQNILCAVMEHKNELSFFSNDGMSYDVVKDEVCNDRLIGLEQAVLLAQEKMSGGQKYSIADIDLKYVLSSDLTEEECVEKHVSYVSPGSPATARPVWSFVLDYQPIEAELEDEPWPRKLINVDMITGEVFFMESFSIVQNAQY